MDDEYEQEREREPEFKNQPFVIYTVFGCLLVFAAVFLAMWIVPKTHILFEATCSPLEDPHLHEKTKDGVTSMLLKTFHHAARFCVRFAC